jgi:hypothetical protein
MAFNRDRTIGIVILSNSANPVDKMGFKILEHLVKSGSRKFVLHQPVNDIFWSDRFDLNVNHHLTGVMLNP